MRASRQGQADKGKPTRASRQGQADKGKPTRAKLYFGDNLGILRDEIKDESVDLIYLDPPFNSKADYNVIFKTPDKIESKAQIWAFNDTWHWTHESAAMYDELLKTNIKIATVIMGLKKAIKENDMMAYLVMMAIRLIELHRVLKNTGALYLHCDPTASHYLKMVLDAVFGPQNFQNEIVWKRTGSHNKANRWGPIHDIIFYYSKSKEKTWNRIVQPYTNEYLNSSYRYTDKLGRYRLTELTGPGTRKGDSGKPWKDVDVTKKGRHWALPNERSMPYWFKQPDSWSTMTSQEKLTALDKQGFVDWGKDGKKMPRFKKYLLPNSGLPLQDIITDILPVSGNEDMGYDTQKPVALLERIISASSNKDDIILDPFCGCGTTVEAAQRLKRSWIGIDITHLAIALIEKRMKDHGADIEVIGVPESFESAVDLAKRDKFQFQTWAVSLIPNALPNEAKTGDGGVDGIGIINLGKDAKGKNKEITVIISVKGGDNVNPDMVRSLAGTARDDDESDKGEDDKLRVLITLREPTKKMTEAAAEYQSLKTPLGHRYPKVQIYTIKDYFDGKPVQLPTMTDYITSKKARSVRRKSRR